MSFTVTIALLAVVNLVHQDAEHDELSERIVPGDSLVVMGLGIADACHDTGENLHIALLGVAVADGLTWRDADDGAIHRESFLISLAPSSSSPVLALTISLTRALRALQAASTASA